MRSDNNCAGNLYRKSNLGPGDRRAGTGIIDFLDVSYIDHKYGWTEDPHIYVIRTRGWSDANYGLELSDPKLLENVGT